jgi:predicted N-acyltransferase
MTNADYGFDVYDSIRRVDWGEWNSLRDERSDPFMDPRFIVAVENSMADQCRFRHIVVRDAQRRPMATVCLSSFVIGGAATAKGAAGKFLGLVQRAIPWINRSKLILCGLPVSAGQSHVRFSPDADREAALRIIDSVARKFARAEWARLIIFKEIDPDGCRDLEPLLSIGYRRADSYPMNRTLTGYSDFDDYLSQVDSKKRTTVRRSQKKFTKSGLRVEDRLGRDHAAEIYTDDVHRLYEAVADQSEVEFGKLPAGFFRELARQLPDNSLFSYVYRDDQVVGFLASLFSETTFHGLFVGLDYSLNSQSELYFNLLYHLVDVGLRRRSQEIYVGQTADEIKNYKLGAYQVPMSLYVRGGRWTMDLVLKCAFSAIFPSQPLQFPRESVEPSLVRRSGTTIDELPCEAGADPVGNPVFAGSGIGKEVRL